MKKLFSLLVATSLFVVMACTGGGSNGSGGTDSYATEDDGDLETGAGWPSPRFFDNGNQTVTDKLTGLMWTKDGNLIKTRDPGFDNDGTAGDGAVTWKHALDYVKKLNQENYLGYSDWRLPNVNELESIVHTGKADTAAWLNAQGFSNAKASEYWSSSTYASSEDSAWIVDMYDGYVDGGAALSRIKFYNPAYVWAVRTGGSGTVELPKTGQTDSYATGDDGDLETGANWPSPRFFDNGNQTVTDKLTGLMWTKDGNLIKTRDPGFDNDGTAGDGAVTWKHALDYVKKLNQENYFGYSDWRLPNRKELRSLINYSQVNTAAWLNTLGFSNAKGSWYWSSSISAGNTYGPWFVWMYDGFVYFDFKSNNNYAWPVRGGQ